MSRNEIELTGIPRPEIFYDAVETYRIPKPNKRVVAELNRQLIRMQFYGKEAAAAALALCLVEEDMARHLERQLANLDDLEARRPQLAKALQSRRERIIEEAFAGADVSRAKINQLLLGIRPALEEDAFWNEDQGWWERFKNDFKEELQRLDQSPPTAFDRVMNNLTFGLWLYGSEPSDDAGR